MAMRLACLGSGRSAQYSPFSTKKNENTASLCGDSHSLLCHSTSSYSTRICKKDVRSCTALLRHPGFDDTIVRLLLFNRALFCSLWIVLPRIRYANFVLLGLLFVLNAHSTSTPFTKHLETSLRLQRSSTKLRYRLGN